MAIGVPELDILLSMVNSMCLAMLTFSMCGLVEFCVLYPDGFGRFNYKFYLDLLLVVGGVLGMLMGLRTTVHHMLYRLDLSHQTNSTLILN